MAGYNWDKGTPQVASNEFARAFTPLRVSDALTPDDATKDVLKQTSISALIAASSTAAAQTALVALASTTGATLVGTSDGGNVEQAIFTRGNQTPVTASKMKISWQKQENSFPVENEGALWPSVQTYSFVALSKEMTNSTVAVQSTGPLTGGPLVNLFVKTDNNGATNDVVGIIADSTVHTNGGTAFGANFLARNEAGTTNTKLNVLELDLEPASGTTTMSGSGALVYNVFNVSNAGFISLANGVGGGTWQNGHITACVTGAHYSVLSGDSVTSASFIDTRNGQFSSAAIKLGKGAGQGINFGGGNFGTSAFLFCPTGTNDIELALGASNFFNVQNSSGTTTFQFDAITPGFVIGSSKVIGVRDTGWTAMTGTSDKSTAYATSTVTLPQLAGRVMALQAALTTHGLIGA